ncbi:hypothetical protein QP185_07865 [Sphingomonas aerolata]|uniref:hypothetical protein n=1 Tax=Sphingomonas aerolata TaxID=185951 RepID=UPI002FE1DBF2
MMLYLVVLMLVWQASGRREGSRRSPRTGFTGSCPRRTRGVALTPAVRPLAQGRFTAGRSYQE